MITNNIVCMKWGDKYDATYVNILAAMVKRNITIPYRFICFTDNAHGIDEHIDVFPIPDFPEPAPEYKKCEAWRKLLLFQNPLHDIEGTILFLDLDVVILDTIDCFFTFSNKMAIIENWSQPNRLIGQASAFCFQMGQYEHLLQTYLKNPDKTAATYRTEQVYITRALGKTGFDFFPKEWCKSFKFHCMPGGILNSFMAPTAIPEGAKIIVFHGNPNPPEAIQGIWGKKVPWFKKFYKTVKPTPWLAEHWRI
ncbi:hypothetical protein OOT00_04300 [Desulfobotulus sp. H1]|uniref:Glycosyltransferase n=1 Tax=Desulfobotulus pelophilus TaxID=2823377 RepID=A0ABT3N6W7_9BACT|nr:hypothetical protein [Desulfobotulus pelophilus]MCW7753205.1 hypothetical protein [Desulfobotulus pelophilus]